MIHQLHLRGALLLYGNTEGETIHHWQLHPVTLNKQKKPQLEAGRSITQEDLETICKQVVPSLVRQVGWIDPHLLAYGTGINGPLIFYRPSIKRAIYFGKQCPLESGIVPWPAMIMVVKPPNLSIFVFKGDQRPNLETELLAPPFLNVYSDYSVCIGHTNTPRNAKPGDIDKWAESFYNSAFTHTNTTDQQFLKKGTLEGFWKNLLNQKRKRFPYHLLKSTGKTVRMLLKEKGLK